MLFVIWFFCETISNTSDIHYEICAFYRQISIEDVVSALCHTWVGSKIVEYDEGEPNN